MNVIKEHVINFLKKYTAFNQDHENMINESLNFCENEDEQKEVLGFLYSYFNGVHHRFNYEWANECFKKFETAIVNQTVDEMYYDKQTLPWYITLKPNFNSTDMSEILTYYDVYIQSKIFKEVFGVELETNFIICDLLLKFVGDLIRYIQF